MALKLTHIALHVQDKAASLRFYRDWCGMVDSSPDPQQKSPWLSSPGKEERFALVLVGGARERRAQPPADVTRMGVAVESRAALEALYARAQAEGIVHTPLEEKNGGRRATFRVTDPDGYVVEFWIGQSERLSRKFNNLSIHVHNMDESREFFRRWCAMEIFHHGSLTQSCRAASPGLRDDFQIVLCAAPAPVLQNNERDISHIGIAVETKYELESLYRRAQAAGLVHWPLHTRPYPAGTLFSIKDPDGHIVEFSHGQPLGDFTPPGLPAAKGIEEGDGTSCPAPPQP